VSTIWNSYGLSPAPWVRNGVRLGLGAVVGDPVPWTSTMRSGLADGLDWLGPRSLGGTASPTARVEHALRLDDLLSETEDGKIMNVYLATRSRWLVEGA
jgi:hypothetical protein